MSKKEETPASAGTDTSVKTPPSGTGPLETIEALAARLSTPDWLFAAVKMEVFGNAEGAMTTEAKFQAACMHVGNTPIGYRSRGAGELHKAHAAVDPTDSRAVQAYDKNRRKMQAVKAKGAK